MILFTVSFLLTQNNYFFKMLVKLKKINQLYISKEEKLADVFGQHQLSFKDFCLFLSNQKKNKKQQKFFIELSNCENKTQIDHLLDCYLLMEDGSMKLELYKLIITSIFAFIIPIIFPYLSKYQFILNVGINLAIIVIWIEEFILKGKRWFDNRINRFFYVFYQRLAYMLPMKSLLITINDFPKNQVKIFKCLKEDVSEGKQRIYSKNKQEEILLTDIYKVCYLNRYTNEIVLKNHFCNLIDKSNKIKENITNIILGISVLIFTIMGITL